jgi:ClpP class serine protease
VPEHDTVRAAQDLAGLLQANRLVDLILHTPGGLVLASLQIARTIKVPPGKITVFVPYLDAPRHFKPPGSGETSI